MMIKIVKWIKSNISKKKYTREKKSESGQELAILLDKMLDRGVVTAAQYSKLNNLIAVPLADEDEIAVPDRESSKSSKKVLIM